MMEMATIGFVVFVVTFWLWFMLFIFILPVVPEDKARVAETPDTDPRK